MKWDQNNKSRNKNKSSLKKSRLSHIEVVCSLCQEKIDEVTSTIQLSGDQAFHFSCYVKKITKDRQLSAKQTISYLGSGNFAIIERQDNSPLFTIIERFPVINKDEELAPWQEQVRRPLQF